MARVPDTTSDDTINMLWEGGPAPPAEVPMTDDEKMDRLFDGELKRAEAVQAAMNRLDRIMHKPYATRRMMYDRIPIGHDVGYRCYDAGKHDAESAFTSGEFGDGLSENEAYADWLRNVDEPPQRASRVIHSSQFEPPEHADDVTSNHDYDDVDFDSDLEDRN